MMPDDYSMVSADYDVIARRKETTLNYWVSNAVLTRRFPDSEEKFLCRGHLGILPLHHSRLVRWRATLFGVKFLHSHVEPGGSRCHVRPLQPEGPPGCSRASGTGCVVRFDYWTNRPEGDLISFVSGFIRRVDPVPL